MVGGGWWVVGGGWWVVGGGWRVGGGDGDGGGVRVGVVAPVAAAAPLVVHVAVGIAQISVFRRYP